MAQIDLGRYDGTISKSVSVADLSSDPNASVYRALGNLGQEAFDLGNQIYQKNLEIKRKSDAWDAYSRYTQEISNDKLKAKSRWDKLGNVDNVPYGEYIAGRSDEISRTIGEGIEDSTTREMFIRMVRPDDLQTKVGGVVDTQQRKLKAAPEYYMEQAQKIGSQSVDINSIEAKDYVVENLDKTLQEANDIIGSFDQDMKKKTADGILLEGGRTLADKYTTLHLSEAATTGQILSEFTGVNILFDPQQRKYVVDWLTSVSPHGKEREKIINDYLQASAGNIRRLIELGGVETKTRNEDIGAIKPYLNDDGSFMMDVIDIEGKTVEKVKLPDVIDPSFGRIENKSTKYFNALPAAEKINFYNKILKQKFEIDESSKKEYRAQLNNIIAAPGVDTFNTKGSALNSKYTEARLSQLMNSPMRSESGITPTEAGTMMAQYSKNMILQQASDDLVAFGPTYEMTDERTRAATLSIASRVLQPNDPALIELQRPESMATILGPMNKEVKREYQNMKALWARDKIAYIQKYGNSRYQKIFNNGVDVNGVFNMNVIAQQKNILDKTTKNFGIAGTADDSIMFKPSINNLNIAIERAQQAGPQAVQSIITNISNVEPTIRGKLVKELVKNRALGDSAEGSTLAYSFLGGAKRDTLSQMQLAEIQDLNTKASRETIYKNFNSTFGSESGKLVQTIDARFNDLVKEKLPALYGDATKEAQPILKALKEPIIASVMQKSQLGMSDSDLEGLMDQEFNKHIASRVTSFNEKNLRGVFPKVSNEDAVNDEAEQRISQIKQDIKSGKVKIDYTQYPELNATLLGRKSGTSKFLQPRTKEEQFLNTYDLSFDGVDPFGGSGNLRLMIRGKNNKTAPLKILNGNQSVDYPVDWTVK